MIYSDCCKAQIIPGTDICSKCKNHCLAVTECSACNGEGKYDVIDRNKVNSQTISPPYKTVTCSECDGTGFISADFPEEWEDEE